MGHLQEAEDEMRRALLLYEQRLAESPNLTHEVLQYGRVCLALGGWCAEKRSFEEAEQLYRKARDAFRTASAHSPAIADWHSLFHRTAGLLLDLLAKRGRLDEAIRECGQEIAALEEALLDASGERALWQHLIVRRLMLLDLLRRTGRPREADHQRHATASAVRRAFEIDRDDYSRLCHYALAALAVGDRDTSAEICRAALNRFGADDNPGVLHLVAWTCALARTDGGDPARLTASARRAVELAPDSRSVRRTLAAVLLRAEQLDEALEHLTAATQADTARSAPAYPPYLLAMTCHHLGRIDEARTHLAEAKRLTAQELADEANPPTWNRKLTFELLRQEAEMLINPPVAAPRP
jgi:tetratricopeptide (TPR) repeat protein